jgi:hypothetical protein
MAFSGMLRRVALVRTDVSEELSASIIRVTRIGELGTLTVATRRNIPEDAILHSHLREFVIPLLYINGHLLIMRTFDTVCFPAYVQ